MSSKFGRIRPRTTELAALERMKEIPLTYNRENDVITYFPLFLIAFSASEKKPLRLIMEKMTSSHFLHYFSSNPFHTCRQ